MRLNREGVFHVFPLEIGISETGENELTTCIISYHIFQERVDGAFVDVADESLEITTWYYLEKKDGTLNDFPINSLKKAFGWDGRDVFWLQDTDLSEHAVQITTEFDTYNGKERLGVKWTNEFGSEGGGAVIKGDDAIRQKIGNRLGSMLRANAGGSPANAAPPKTAAPARSTPGAATTSPPENAPHDATPDEAWSDFSKACNAGWSQTDCEKEWFRIIDLLFGKKADALTPADWGRMKVDGPREIIPI